MLIWLLWLPLARRDRNMRLISERLSTYLLYRLAMRCLPYGRYHVLEAPGMPVAFVHMVRLRLDSSSGALPEHLRVMVMQSCSLSAWQCRNCIAAG